jgi:hypothetical protein
MLPRKLYGVGILSLRDDIHCLLFNELQSLGFAQQISVATAADNCVRLQSVSQ